MAEVEHTDFEAVFQGMTCIARETKLETRAVDIGEITLNQTPGPGALEVRDLFSEREEPPPGHVIGVELPSGTFPVQLCLFTDPRGASTREVVAAARIVFDRAAIAEWRNLPDLYDRRLHPAYEYPGHGVDSGTSALVAATSPPRRVPLFDEPTTDEIATGVSVYRWPGRPDVLAFTAGYGGGGEFYAAWGGYDERGRIVQLAIDYEALTDAHWEYVDLPLPFTSDGVAHDLVALLGVTPVVEGPARLRLDGDVARLWSGTLLDERGEPLADPAHARVSPTPRAPRGTAPFAQLFDISNRPPESRRLRLRLYLGRRPLR
ncbi:MAG: hypothetical protein R3B13_26775 [Polyangiaceae bacterium]